MRSLPASLVIAFLKRYYSVLPNKPETWKKMIEDLSAREKIDLLPI
jgi:hypothetical protein